MCSFNIMIYQEKNYRRATPELTNCVTCFRLSSYLLLYSRSSSSFCSTWCWRLAIVICSRPSDANGEPLAMLSPAFLAPTLERSLFYKMVRPYAEKDLHLISSMCDGCKRGDKNRGLTEWHANKQLMVHRWHWSIGESHDILWENVGII